MNSILKSICLFLFALPCALSGQTLFDIRVDTASIAGLPGLHSFAAATHEGKWLFIGGRIDGMHQKFNAFGTSSANQQIQVVDPVTGQLWQRPLSELPDTLRE